MPAELKPITAIVPKKEIDIVKTVFKELKDRLPNLEYTPFKYGRLGDKHIISFKVDAGYFNLFVEKFTFNKIKILFLEKEQKEIADRAEAISNKSSDAKSVDWTALKELKSNTSQKSMAQIDSFIKNGDYTRLLAISRDISQSKEIIERAGKNISVAINNAIERERQKSESSRIGAEEAIDNLIAIAGDKTLKNMGQTELAKIAGQMAINLCCTHRKHLDRLIDIANSNAVPYLTSVKAAIQLGDILMDNQNDYADDLSLAIRKLNLRWLENAYDIVRYNLDPHEIETFYSFTIFLDQKRNAKFNPP